MGEFHDVRFPTTISFGATGGPERRVEIVAMASGREYRNLRHAHSRRRYDVGTGLRSIADLQELVAFFEARRGPMHGFRFADPFDRKSSPGNLEPSGSDQWLGTGDGETTRFAIVKSYGSGGDAYRRPIHTPVPGTVSVTQDEAAVPAAAYTVDHLAGEITFAEPPAAGVALACGYAFDVPVRFDIDHIAISIAAFEAGQIPTIPLLEIEP